MSFVEQAIKKLREASRATEQPSIVTGQVVSQPTGRVGESEFPSGNADAAPVQFQPSRTLEIDREALRRAGLIPPESQERQIADEYRHIKRPLIKRALERETGRIENGHLIMVASAAPGDGKTFTSLNLAFSMALEKDLSVLLVDADVAKPHISRLLGMNQEPGLLDVLLDESLDVERVILPTNVPRLSVLPAGTPCETATELLASDRMRRVVARLDTSVPNRIVLLDSPPLLLTNESRVLAGIVGQIVLVVAAGRTPQRAVLDTLDLLGEGRSVGLVLNQCDEYAGGYRYEYYAQNEASRNV